MAQYPSLKKPIKFTHPLYRDKLFYLIQSTALTSTRRAENVPDEPQITLHKNLNSFADSTRSAQLSSTRLVLSPPLSLFRFLYDIVFNVFLFVFGTVNLET
jgi:hypothetical protein